MTFPNTKMKTAHRIQLILMSILSLSYALYSQQVDEQHMRQVVDSAMAKLRQRFNSDSTQPAKSHFQEYEEMDRKIVSLQNKESLVHIKYDFPFETVSLSLSNGHKICFSGCRGFVEDSSVTDRHFLSLLFSFGGGYGVRQKRHVLVCISDAKIITAMDIISFTESDFTTTYNREIDSLKLYDEHQIYRISIAFLHNRDNEEYLNAEVYDFVKSKYDPKSNHETRDTIRLQFNKADGIFFNDYKRLQGNYLVDHDVAANVTTILFHGQPLPMIRLGENEYYYVKDRWYSNERDRRLYEMPNECQ